MTEESNKKSSAHQTNLNCDNVLQQIQVEKQEFKCIINLNTIVCPNNSKCRKKCGRKHRTTHSEGNEKNETQNKNEKTPKNEHEHENSATRKGNGENKEKNGTRIKEDYRKPKSESAISNHSAIKRMVPTCSRRVCWDYHESRKERLRRRNAVQINRHEEWKKKSSNKYRVKPVERHKSRPHHNSSRKIKQMRPRSLLSPMSSSPLMDVTYEDISSISFETCINEKPMAYKLHRRHCGHVREHRKKVHESKLDTLIRRTKERERKLVERSRCDRGPWFTSTPIQIEYSSADFPMSCSEMDISFNSLPTMVLETKHSNAYKTSNATCLTDVLDNQNTTEYFHNTYEDFQNTNENFHNTNEDFENIKESIQKTSQYFQRSNTERLRALGSPCSHTSYATIVPKDNSYKKHVKNEPATDVKAYSPTSTPKMQYAENNIKRENKIRTEPLFPCAISPIYYQNIDNTGLEFCKKENVKSESADH